MITELVNTPTEIQFTLLIAIIGLYKITTGSIKIGLDIKQFGASSEDRMATLLYVIMYCGFE